MPVLPCVALLPSPLRRAPPLSVHLLNLQDGLPSPGAKVLLEKQDGKNWTELNSSTTNEQGRIPLLLSPYGFSTYRGN